MPPTIVNIPGVGDVEFPDSMSPDQINAAAKRLYEEAQQSAPKQEPAKDTEPSDNSSLGLNTMLGGVAAGSAALGARQALRSALSYPANAAAFREAVDVVTGALQKGAKVFTGRLSRRSALTSPIRIYNYGGAVLRGNLDLGDIIKTEAEQLAVEKGVPAVANLTRKVLTKQAEKLIPEQLRNLSTNVLKGMAAQPGEGLPKPGMFQRRAQSALVRGTAGATAAGTAGELIGELVPYALLKGIEHDTKRDFSGIKPTDNTLEGSVLNVLNQPSVAQAAIPQSDMEVTVRPEAQPQHPMFRGTSTEELLREKLRELAELQAKMAPPAVVRIARKR